MKEVPSKKEGDVGGGVLYEPWCPPPGDPGYPQMPGCPTFPDPPLPVIDDPSII